MSHPPSILLSCSTEPALINLTSRPKEVPGRDRRGVDYIWSITAMSAYAFPCTQRGEGCILHRLAASLMGLKSLMCSICILMKTVFHAAASELEQHGSPAARHGVVVVGGDGSVGISESRATSNMCSNCSSSIGGGGGEKPTTRRPSRRRE